VGILYGLYVRYNIGSTNH